jgi:hypothetical protein
MALMSVSKRTAQKFDMRRFNLKNLNNMKVKQEFQVKISNTFAVLENLYNNAGISRTWENIRGNMKASVIRDLGYYELKQQKHDLMSVQKQ